nr:unnamed protein product [Spirometra erinaceieuropaei]
MRQQPGNVNSISHSYPCRKPRNDHGSCVDHSGQCRQHYISHPPPPEVTKYDVPSSAVMITSTPTSSGVDSIQMSPHCDHTFTSHISLIGQLRIRRTETGEPVPGAPTYPRRIHLTFPHCPCTSSYRTSLLGYMHICGNLG